MSYRDKVSMGQVSAKDALNDYAWRTDGFKRPAPAQYRYLRTLLVIFCAIIAAAVWRSNCKQTVPVVVPIDQSAVVAPERSRNTYKKAKAGYRMSAEETRIQKELVK